jgi:hypothetical protein
MAAGQDELDLRLPAGQQQRVPGGAPRRADAAPPPITAPRMGHLWDALEHAYRVLGLELERPLAYVAAYLQLTESGSTRT